MSGAARPQLSLDQVAGSASIPNAAQRPTAPAVSESNSIQTPPRSVLRTPPSASPVRDSSQAPFTNTMRATPSQPAPARLYGGPMVSAPSRPAGGTPPPSGNSPRSISSSPSRQINATATTAPAEGDGMHLLNPSNASSTHPQTMAGGRQQVGFTPRGRVQSPYADEVEELCPLRTQARSVERFFVEYHPKADTEEGENTDPVDLTVNEAEEAFDRFAEYTDDDSFFSSSSGVIEEDPRRMQFDILRERAVQSVFGTINLRSHTNGRVPQQVEDEKRHNARWIYQVHQRAIALHHSSFFIFPAGMKARVVVYNLLHHWLTEVLILLSILVYSIMTASWARHTGPLRKPDFMVFGDVFFTVFYMIELLLRLFASGFILHQRACFRSLWHWLDAAVVLLMIMNCCEWPIIWNFTAFRLIRVIKCCSYVPFPVGLKLLAKSFLRSTNKLIQVSVILLYVLFFFALLGLQLFSGQLHYRCVSKLNGVVSQRTCRPSVEMGDGIYWGRACDTLEKCELLTDKDQYNRRHFDHLGHALLSTFHIMTFQNWTGLLQQTNDGVAVLAVFYYIFVIISCAWFIPSLYLGVFIEKFDKTNRLFVQKQLQFLDSMLLEQQQRLNAAVKLRELVERDETGKIRKNPLLPNAAEAGIGATAGSTNYNPISINSDNSDMQSIPGAGENAAKKRTKWTDEQRVQLHLSLTRQRDVSEAAERKKRDVLRVGSSGTSITITTGSTGGATTNASSTNDRSNVKSYISNNESSRPVTVHNNAQSAVTPTVSSAIGGDFALGGRVGDVQHHQRTHSIGTAHGTSLPLAVRLENEQERLRFLEQYQSQVPETEEEVESGRISGLPPPTSNGVSTGSRRREEVSRGHILATRESPGVIPNIRCTSQGVSSASNMRSRSANTEGGASHLGSKDTIVQVEQQELLINDPEGGDFRFAKDCGDRWSIIRNITHMFTEGYPRIITQYLWEQKGMQKRYGLMPLNYVNKYEDAVIRKLRQRHVKENQRRQHARKMYNNRNAYANDDYYNEDEPYDDRMYTEMGNMKSRDGSGRDENKEGYYKGLTPGAGGDIMGDGNLSPVCMAHNIVENAPITPLHCVILIIIFLNGVFNATRHYDQPNYWDDVLFYVGVVFTSLFFFEFVIRLVAVGFGPFFTNFFNILDVVVTILGFFELGFNRSNVITVLNWARFLRLFRVAPFAPMRRVTRVFLLALPDLIYALLFFSVYMFMWILIGMSFFGSRMGLLNHLHDTYTTRGGFDTFSHAAYAVSQAFSYTRDEWVYMSWNGARSRDEYTVLYFIAVVLVAFIFRYLFIAVFTWAWQCEEEREEIAMHATGRSGAPRLRWFDFTVWRSFKHIHGGFERRDVAPDEVYHLNQDMRRQLRIAEAKERFFRKDVMARSPSGPMGGGENQQLSISIGSNLADTSQQSRSQHQRQPHFSEQPSGVSQAPIGPQFLYVGRRLMRQMSLPSEFGGGAGGGISWQASSVIPNRTQFPLQPTPLNYARRYNVVPAHPPTNAQVSLQHQLPSAAQWRSRSPPYVVAADTVPDGNMEDSSIERSLESRRGVARVQPSTSTPRRSSVPGHFVTLDYVRRQESSTPGEMHVPEDDATVSDSATGVGGERVYDHILLPGPRLRYKHVLAGRRRRVFERCLDCNTHKQMVLRAPPNVKQRTVEELHAEHCHMAAVRSSKQLVLNAIIGYVRMQKDMGSIPTREAVETVLGQAWSCGMLLFETIEYLAGSDIEMREYRTWDRTLEALELQQWLVGLHVGEEQVGRATLAYTLAHQKTQEKETAERSFSLSWRKRSFFIFAPSNPIRRFATDVVDSKLFEWLVMGTIFAASISLCFYVPFENRSDNKYIALTVVDGFFTALFAIEMILKWTSKGVFLDVHEAYFWHRWNVVDFFIVILSILGVTPDFERLRCLKVIRCFRILGPFRFFKFNRELSTLVVALWDCVPTAANVLLLCLVNYIVWAILAVQLFMGKFYSCSNSTYVDRTKCIVNGSAQWETTQRNFDNFPQSLLTMFEVSTGSRWMDVIYSGVDGWSTQHSPINDYQQYKGLFFFLYYYVSNFVFFSLFVASIIYCYLLAKNAAEGVAGITFEHQLWIHMQRMIFRLTPRVRLIPMGNFVSRFLHKLVTHWAFDFSMGIVLILNMLSMSLYWYNMSSSQEEVLDLLQYVWVAFFTAEVILRLMAHGIQAFTREEYCFEVFLLIFSYLQIALHTLGVYTFPFNVNILRVLRMGRVLKVLRVVFPIRHHLGMLRDVIMLSGPIVLNVTLILILGIFVFAVLGLHTIGPVAPHKGRYIDTFYDNFATFPNSIIMTFRLATLEDWVSMLRSSTKDGNICATGQDCGLTNWAPVFYVAIVICFALVIVSLYMAVVVDNYVAVARMNASVSRLHDLYRFRELWSEIDPNSTLVIRTKRLPELLESLRPPLGLSSRHNRVELLRLMREYDIPDHGGKVHYHEVLTPLARRILAMAFMEFELEGRSSAFEAGWRHTEKSLRALPSVLVNYSYATVAQHFAASYVQAAFRRDKARRRMYRLQSTIWRNARAVCDENNLPYADYGFGSVSIAGEDPKFEAQSRGIVMQSPMERPKQRKGTDMRSVSPKDGPERNSAPLSAILPGVYQPASEDKEKLFGPDVPNAVRRHETRSEKLRRKEEQQQQQQQRQSASEAPIPMGRRASRSQPGSDYQPPLGSDPGRWLHGEMKRSPSQVSQGSTMASANTPEQLQQQQQ